MQNTKPKQDRLGQLISKLDSTTNSASSMFANKADLESAHKRIAELEAQLATGKASPLSAQLAAAQATITRLQSENQALKARPLAIAPKASTAPAKPPTTAQDWQPKPKPTISKAGFDKLTPTERMEFIKQGGKISN